MMNTCLFFIICSVMLVIGVIAHIVSFILNKYYKKKMGKMADLKKAEK